MIDPKVVELQQYNALPHLVVPVVTDPKKVILALRWVVNEMEKRYQIFARVGVRNIASFNSRPNKKLVPQEPELPLTPKKEKVEPGAEGFAVEVDEEIVVPREEDIVIPEKLSYIVVIIDELADLMLVAPADVEMAIARITQMARAAGIHCIVATQRPSVDVITGVIKANIPARIAFQVRQRAWTRGRFSTRRARTNCLARAQTENSDERIRNDPSISEAYRALDPGRLNQRGHGERAQTVCSSRRPVSSKKSTDSRLGRKSLMVAVKNIARRLGDDISESKPILDSRLPDGSRVAAVIPPCSLNGVTLTIRKFNSRHFGIEDLIKVGTIERSLANQLENFVLARKNILITGGTGTGKTTLVNILGKFIPPDERILLIEDTSEIQMGQDNLVRFEARQPQNGLPAVSIRDLLKAALRHRPDRIILGEIRGGEAFDLLQLLNTGHSGSLSTVHATSAKQGLARFTSCVLQSGVELPYRAIKSNIGDSLNVVVQLERRPGRRFISEVLEIHRYDPDADEYEFCAIYQKREEPR